MDSPVINYPCQWSYRVIGSDREVMEHEIANRLGSFEYSLRPSHTSRSGKYVSLELSTTVTSEAQRLGIFEILKDLPTVRFVL